MVKYVYYTHLFKFCNSIFTLKSKAEVLITIGILLMQVFRQKNCCALYLYCRLCYSTYKDKNLEAKMKVLMINGSSNKNGCTMAALTEIEKVLKTEGVGSEIYQLGNESQFDCIGCGACRKTQKCAFTQNNVNEFVEKAQKADGFVFASPVYYAHPSGRILSFLDRAFYSNTDAFRFKPGASIVSARRAGTTASIDVLNKYFSIATMPIVGSTYWNMVHGVKTEEVSQDAEGLQTIRNLGKNMAWMIKCIEAGKEKGVVLPELERTERTNFVR